MLAVFALATFGSCSTLVVTGADEFYPAIGAIYWGLLAIPFISMITGALFGGFVAVLLLGVLRLVRGRNVTDPPRYAMWCIAAATAVSLFVSYLDFFGLR